LKPVGFKAQPQLPIGNEGCLPGSTPVSLKILGEIMGKNSHVTGYGPKCFRCGCKTLRFEHKRISEKMLKQPYYYTFWYCCINNNCKTTLIMPEQAKVKPDRSVQPELDLPFSEFLEIDPSKPPWDE